MERAQITRVQLISIVRIPYVVVEDLVGVGKVRNGLPTHYPDPAVEG